MAPKKQSTIENGIGSKGKSIAIAGGTLLSPKVDHEHATADADPSSQGATNDDQSLSLYEEQIL